MPGRDVCFNCDRDSLYIAGKKSFVGDSPMTIGRPIGPVDNYTERNRAGDRSMAELYPKYYKAIPAGWKTIDVYGVCKLFPVADDTGCINHARKKLLVPGVRTGGKTMRDDIREARDTLNRWLQLNPEAATASTK